MIKFFDSINDVTKNLSNKLLTQGNYIQSKKWQGIDSPDSTIELLMVGFSLDAPHDIIFHNNIIGLNKEWADFHFEERISGKPLNPGESYKKWPFYKMDKVMRTEGEKFTHTYMERFWPKDAGDGFYTAENGNSSNSIGPKKAVWMGYNEKPTKGIRYEYGDLSDVINLLCNDLLTRQAYLPIWHPEDTGNLHGGRIPCSIGYDFIIRDNKLHMMYHMRSCDFIRHFADDVYLAFLMINYVVGMVNLKMETKIKPGTLSMTIKSLHIFKNDLYTLKKINEKTKNR